MASLKKRGRIWWIRYYVGPKLLEKSLKTRRKDEAVRALKELNGREARGELAAPSRIPVPVFLEEYGARLKLRSPEKAWKIDMGRLKSFFARAGVKTLEQVTPALISHVLEEGLRNGWSAKTFNNYREVVHRAFSYAVRERGFVSPRLGRANPASFVRRVEEPAPRITYLPLADIDELLAHLSPHVKMQAAVATLIYAGLRRSELLWLTVDDLDLSSRLIMVRGKTVGNESWEPKTRKNRAVPVSDSLLSYLDRWLHVRPDSIWLFPASKGGRWDGDNFSAALRDAQRGKEERWSCLDFRHTFASHLAKKGVSIFKIAKLLGNTVPICERHYAHLSPAGLAEEVEFRAPMVREQGASQKSTSPVRSSALRWA